MMRCALDTMKLWQGQKSVMWAPLMQVYHESSRALTEREVLSLKKALHHLQVAAASELRLMYQRGGMGLDSRSLAVRRTRHDTMLATDPKSATRVNSEENDVFDTRTFLGCRSRRLADELEAIGDFEMNIPLPDHGILQMQIVE
jgi:hypothetical protein